MLRIIVTAVLILAFNTIIGLSSNSATGTEVPVQNPLSLDAHSEANFRQNNSCNEESASLRSKFPSCAPSSCDRIVLDGVFSHDDVAKLKEIAVKGMATRTSKGGPTILDLNTGYIRDSAGLINLFVNHNSLFSAEDFAAYGSIILRLKALVQSSFGADELFFTAPTFITRIDGRADWQPQGIHDEYWHTHADTASTPHYHYSGLLYLSTYNEDFAGGRLHLLKDDRNTTSQLVEPKAGRVAMFTSGWETPHFFERVTRGQRMVLSFWFTCDVKKEFQIFLDGQAHIAFGRKVKQQLEKRKVEL